MTVALVERKLFGGTCVNTGCMPTKTLVASAYAAHLARRAARLRRRARRRASASTWRRVKARADAVAAELAHRRRDAGCAAWPAARSPGPRALRVAATRSGSATSVLTAPRIFINVGGRAVVPRHAGRRRGPVPRPTRTILDAGPRCPSTWSSSAAATSGSSSRRCTGASAPRSRSSRRQPRLISREDEDISEPSRSILEREGIAVRTRRRVHPPRAARARASCRRRRLPRRATRGRSARTCCSRSAAARTPTISGSTRAGVATDARGYIVVDDQLCARTSPASGRSATATAAAPSRTPRTTTSRSSRPTCSTASRAG